MRFLASVHRACAGPRRGTVGSSHVARVTLYLYGQAVALYDVPEGSSPAQLELARRADECRSRAEAMEANGTCKTYASGPSIFVRT